jgi:hypothetical protein
LRTHLVVKLVLAALESLFAAAVTLQVVVAFVPHFFMKLARAAPASFFSAAAALQLTSWAWTAPTSPTAKAISRRYLRGSMPPS